MILDSIDKLLAAIDAATTVLSANFGTIGDFHCSPCSGARRVNVRTLYTALPHEQRILPVGMGRPDFISPQYLVPSLFDLTCVQCPSTPMPPLTVFRTRL